MLFCFIILDCTTSAYLLGLTPAITFRRFRRCRVQVWCGPCLLQFSGVSIAGFAPHDSVLDSLVLSPLPAKPDATGLSQVFLAIPLHC